VHGSLERARDVVRFSPAWGDLLVAVVGLGSEYHDLGKLDPENQGVLRTDTRQRLPVRHEDAGAAHLLSRADVSRPCEIAAVIVYAHHEGLPSFIKEEDREELRFRIGATEPGEEPTYKKTDDRLDSYRTLHEKVVARLSPEHVDVDVPPTRQLLYRVALSCLVDADHSDTARHYKNEPSRVPPEGRFAERLAALDEYVRKLSSGKTDPRTLQRQRVYEACWQADTTPALRECDSPVGTGKTTAVMAHLLRAGKDKKLRRLFVVLPFTNIIDQAVDIYRKSLVLPGEDPELVVAAVHHKAEYRDPDSRHLAALWDAPVVVTTAVQFFETLAASSTGGLRKLHALPGSGVFIDESHAALPARLWPRAWDWIKQLADEWGCHFVLGSGSLNRIWTIPEIEPEARPLLALVDLPGRIDAYEAEQRRITIRSREKPLTIEELSGWLDVLPGPRLVIVNTVQIAAALAQELAKPERKRPGAVMHLSTALTPHHRAITLARIKARLDYGIDTDWTLVATSCVEAGVDISFRTGLRQRSSLSSLLQTGGRVNRGGEYDSAEVWDFQLIRQNLVNVNPAFEDSAEILGDMFKKNQVSPEHCTHALKAEILQTRRSDLNADLRKAESSLNFPEVQKRFRVVDAETRTVVISKSLRDKIVAGDRIDWRELQRHSVQLYADKVEWHFLRPAPGCPDVFFWDLPYDDFLGYMVGALPLVQGDQDGGFID
jgi:CRISPR-associated endonuclease/helicase Cas3